RLCRRRFGKKRRLVLLLAWLTLLPTITPLPLRAQRRAIRVFLDEDQASGSADAPGAYLRAAPAKVKPTSGCAAATAGCVLRRFFAALHKNLLAGRTRRRYIAICAMQHQVREEFHGQAHHQAPAFPDL